MEFLENELKGNVQERICYNITILNPDGHFLENSYFKCLGWIMRWLQTHTLSYKII